MFSRFFSKNKVPVAYDMHHPAYLAVINNDLGTLRRLCSSDPAILTEVFLLSETKPRYMGNGVINLISRNTTKSILNLAVSFDKTEIATWLISQCFDNNAFLDSVFAGNIELVTAFCNNPRYHSFIPGYAALLFEQCEDYVNFDLRQGYVRDAQIRKHPCPKVILEILFSHMTISQVDALIEKRRSVKDEKIRSILTAPMRTNAQRDDPAFIQNVVVCINQAFESIVGLVAPLVEKRRESDLDVMLDEALVEITSRPR